jgi:aldose 1-epimerase
MLNIDGQEISIAIDLDQGGRLVSLQWRDLEFVLPHRGTVVNWGWYAMAPWAGRIADGILIDKKGGEHILPTNVMPPHAIHGLGLMGSWAETGKGRARLELPAPYEGAYVDQHFEILDDAVRWTLEYEPNGCELPSWIGMHPWFPRELGRGGDAELNFSAGKMFVRDEDGIPTGELITPLSENWDDCFTDVRGVPEIVWPGAARVSIESDAQYWVVYNEDTEGIAIEPQTAPPDAANLKIEGEHYIEALFTFSEDFG